MIHRILCRQKQPFWISLLQVFLLSVCGVIAFARYRTTQEKLLQEEEDLESCKLTGIGKTGGFCLNENQIFVGYNNLWGPKFAGAIESVVQKGSLLDFGAGLGHYGRYFLRKKERIFAEKFYIEEKLTFFDKVKDILHTPPVITYYEGYDGALNIERVTSSFIKHLDLAKEQDLGRRFDWVMSIEVGEHIPNEYEAIFLDNVVRHACKGVILSWAVEGQGGHFHVNNHNNSYVRDKMIERGFSTCDKQENFIRETTELGWIKNTVMVFLRNDPLEDRNCKGSVPKSC